MERPQPRFRFSKRCLKICLVLSSVVLWVQGAAFLLLGVFIHSFLKNFFTDGKGLKVAGGFPVVAIILGVVMVSVALLANFFVLFPSKLRYFLLALMLISIFVFEIIFFIAGFQYAKTIEKVLKEGYESAMINYRDGFIVNLEINFLQWTLQCCGAKDFKDWYTTSWASGRMEVPESCCIDLEKCHNLEPVMVDDINQKGCLEKIEAVIKAHNIGLILTITFAGLSQFLGIVLTISLLIKEFESATMRATAASSERPIMDEKIYN